MQLNGEQISRLTLLSRVALKNAVVKFDKVAAAPNSTELGAEITLK